MIKTFAKMVLFFSALAYTMIISAAMPKYSYACHVTTDAKIDGIVLLQANSLKDAETHAINVKALTHVKGSETLAVSNSKATSISVVECILTPTNRFRDRSIQEFYKKLPM